MVRLSLRSAHAGQDGQQDTQYKRDTQGQSRAQKVSMAGPIFVFACSRVRDSYNTRQRWLAVCFCGTCVGS